MMSALVMLLGIAVGAYFVDRAYAKLYQLESDLRDSQAAPVDKDYQGVVFGGVAACDIDRGDVLQWTGENGLTKATSLDVNPALIAGVAVEWADKGDVVEALKFGWILNFIEEPEKQGRSLFLSEDGTLTDSLDSIGAGEVLVTVGSSPPGSEDVWINIRVLDRRSQ